MDVGFVDQRLCFPHGVTQRAKVRAAASAGCGNIAFPSVHAVIRQPSAAAKASGWSEWDSALAPVAELWACSMEGRPSLGEKDLTTQMEQWAPSAVVTVCGAFCCPQEPVLN